MTVETDEPGQWCDECDGVVYSRARVFIWHDEVGDAPANPGEGWPEGWGPLGWVDESSRLPAWLKRD